MKNTFLFSVIIATGLTGLGLVAMAQTTGSAPVDSLRGGDVDEYVPVDGVYHQDEKRFKRNYRQQPPLIPHSIDQYQIDLAANQCLGCHDWSKAGERGAPTLSMTHYMDREGNQLDQVAGTRWFCNQCHVPQADAPALVDNLFQPSN
ncbi:nitrate reductase cytochrome c-type subunit [Thioclava sp. FR2]|uniref:nitrate reductase cytochrome c-type subunit n=1 Tax=Thioclava sp. FR2 TaxID=3445780 RepID=UPI003EBE3DED